MRRPGTDLRFRSSVLSSGDLTMRSTCAILSAAATAACLLAPQGAQAHCFVGGRFFPATLGIDDPCVADELSIPTVTWTRTGDTPSAQQTDVSLEFSKRITEYFGVSVSPT